jgi:hypothetical protein
MNVELDTNREPGSAPYGYCPKCGAEGYSRERRPDGDDKCAKGHTYPSSAATATPNPVPMFKEPEPEQVVALGDANPILNDVARAHGVLGDVRAAVADTVRQVFPDRAGEPVMAFSIVSAGLGMADQMVVYSPGGGGLRNAKQARTRLKLALDQLDALIDDGAFN